MSKRTIEWNRCTWYSMLCAALVLIIGLPILAFYIGMQYQETLTVMSESKIPVTMPLEVPIPLQYREEARSETGAVLPFIISYKNSEAMERVNTYLLDMSTRMSCDSSSGRDDDELREYYSYNATSSVTYAKHDIYSISIHSSYFCGGAHPNNDVNESITFDMKTGEPVSFEQLFTKYEEDKEKIVSLIFASQIQKAEESVDEESCDSMFTLDRLTDSEYSYTLGDKGITIEPNWPHVIEACEEAITVPISELSSFIDPSSIVSRYR
jgi:hypothetical protein